LCTLEVVDIYKAALARRIITVKKKEGVRGMLVVA
jgi:hypothetical protein